MAAQGGGQASRGLRPHGEAATPTGRPGECSIETSSMLTLGIGRRLEKAVQLTWPVGDHDLQYHVGGRGPAALARDPRHARYPRGRAGR